MADYGSLPKTCHKHGIAAYGGYRLYGLCRLAQNLPYYKPITPIEKCFVFSFHISI
jgi:hypothetical protein